MRNIFGIVGWSGSGKTHLICRIIKYFDNKKLNICSIKHSHHNFEVDKKGKDSYEHLRSGSKEVVIYNEYKFAMINIKPIDKTATILNCLFTYFFSLLMCFNPRHLNAIV